MLSEPTWTRKPEPHVRYGQTFLPGVAVLGRQHLAEARPLLDRADAVRGRRFAFLGRTVGFPGRIEWEPAGLSDAWRVALSGLDDVLPLGVAAALAPTVEARRRWYEVATNLVREWMGAVEPGHGVGWRLPALARRIPNLLYVHALFGAELRVAPPQRRALLESLYAQASALAAALPAQPPDEHLIHAGRALFMAGRFFDGMEARGWLEAGAAVLWTQLREQVHEDGGHRARNPVVQGLVLADYLEIFAVLLGANDDVPVWARKRVKAMADFLARLLHPDDEIPLFHGAALGIARPSVELLATAAIVLHEPELAPPGDLPGVWPLLVTGDAGRRTHVHLPRRREGAEPRALRKTGFYVLPGEPGDLLLLDGGGSPVAGDDNTFGYELSVGGSRLIVDAGVGSEDTAPWREYFRSTRAHNVVTVGDAEQRANGRTPAVSDVHWVVRSGLLYFTGTHDGFARLALDLRLSHRRHVFCLPGRFWLVCDEILGSGTWDLESFVHFHPRVTLAGVCRGRPAFVARRSDTAWAQIVPSGAQEVRLVRGVEEPRPQGWYAARHGERRPAPALSLVRSGRLPHVFGYAIVPRSDTPVELRFDHDAFRLHVRLATEDAEYAMTAVQGDVEIVSRAR